MDNRIEAMLESPGVAGLSQNVFEVRNEPKDWRLRFLTILGDMYPDQLLWSRDFLGDDEFEPIPAMPNCWRLNTYDDTEKHLSRLYEGGWGLFFGEEDTLFAEEVPPEYLPAETEAIEDLLESAGAKALILSWYDDNEWMIALCR